MQTKSQQSFPVRNLTELERVAVAFRKLAVTLPVELTRTQRQGWRWIVEAFYAPSIMQECRGLSQARKDEVNRILTSVENIFGDDDDDDDDANPDALPSLKQGRFQWSDDDCAAAGS